MSIPNMTEAEHADIAAKSLRDVKMPRGRNGGRRPRSPESGPFEHVGARLPAEDAAWMREQARGHPDGVSGFLRDVIRRARERSA